MFCIVTMLNFLCMMFTWLHGGCALIVEVEQYHVLMAADKVHVVDLKGPDATLGL